jgi:hypothetical protein
MRNKYLLIADAHIHHEPQWRFDWLAKELAQLYDEYAHTHQLMLLGDVFEVRDRIDARAANLFLDTVVEWQKKNRVIWITGQHDSYVPGRATFEGLRGLRDGVRGVFVADKPLWYTVEPGVVAVPYCRDMAQYRALLKNAQRGGAHTLFTHMPVKEAVPNGPDDMVCADDFNAFSQVISGDIHKQSAFGRLMYVGVLAPRDFRDEGAHGAYATFEDGKLRLYASGAPEFWTMTSRDDLRDYMLATVARRGVIRIKDFEVSDQELVALHSHPSVIDLVYLPAVVTETLSENLKHATTPDQIISEFLDTVDVELNKKFLREFALTIYKAITDGRGETR